MGEPKPFDLLAEFGKFGLRQNLALTDPNTRIAFVRHVSQKVDDALADPILMHGQRAEAMFEALLASLGKFRLAKPEDAGRVISADVLRVPDFRVVLKNGEQWLVEVKNIYISDPFAQRRKVMNASYLNQLEVYASATGATLKLAIFWARWSIWTLVTPRHFSNSRGDIVVDMMAAMQANELAVLGDRLIGTRPPLTLRLSMDPDRTSTIDDNGRVKCVIGGAKLYSGPDEIKDPTEQQIAWMLMQHGEWSDNGGIPIIEGDRLISLDFTWAAGDHQNDGFELIGTLSRVFARYFAEATVQNDSVVQILAPHRPGWFKPLLNADHVCKDLPLWVFHMQPSDACKPDSAT